MSTAFRISDLPKFRAEEPGRRYLELLVRPHKGRWLATCNGARHSAHDALLAARICAEQAFSEFWDCNVSHLVIRLERDTEWELIASTTDPLPTI